MATLLNKQEEMLDFLQRPTSCQTPHPPEEVSESSLRGGAHIIDPASGECPNCRGRWRYRRTTDGNGQTSMVEDYFEVTEPCEAHQKKGKTKMEETAKKEKIFCTMNPRDFSILNEIEHQKLNEEEEEFFLAMGNGSTEDQPVSTALTKSDQQLITNISVRLEAVQRNIRNLVVDSEEKAKEATASLALVRKSRKQLEKRRFELTRPLDKIKKVLALPFRELETSLKNLDEDLAPKLSRYHDEVEAKRRNLAEEARQRELEALKAREREHLEQAEINESALALEDAIATKEQIEEMESAPNLVSASVVTRTIVGSAHRQRPWTYRVMDLKKVPRRFLATLNEKGHLESGHSLVMAAIKNGEREIAGVKIYQKSSISIR